MTLIRRAMPEDLPACARILCGWQRAASFLPDDLTEEVVLPMMQDAVLSREMWVGEDTVEGSLSVAPEERPIGAIHPDRPGRGIGHTLMKTAKHNRDFLWLTVTLPNTRAQALCRREGGELARTLPPPEAGDPEMYRMEWRRDG